MAVRSLAWRFSNLDWRSTFVVHTRKTPASLGLGLGGGVLEGGDAAAAEVIVVSGLAPAFLADETGDEKIGDPLVRAVGRQEV